MGNLAPLYLMCDPRDIGVIAQDRSPQLELPTVMVYDRVPAGIGFALTLFDLHDELLQAAGDLVSRCRCALGCPACTGPGQVDGQVKQHVKRLLECIVP
jgi:DEAD/DEAH box helicase domain-containing protein